MVTAAVALEEPATRRSIRRRSAFAAGLALVAVALLATALSIYRSDRSTDSVQRTGTATQATVTSVQVEPSGRGNFPTGSAVVAFDADGQPQQATIYLSTGVTGVQSGQTLDIVYDPADPAHAQIAGARPSNQGLPFVPVAFVGVVVGGMALVAARHTRTVRALVAAHPWQAVPARVEVVAVGSGNRTGSRVLVRLDTADGPRAMESVGLNRIDPGCEPEAWVAGLPAERVVVARPGGAHPVYVRQVT